MREAFEAYIKEKWPTLANCLRRDGDNYDDRDVDFLWQGWRAAFQHIAVALLAL